MSPDFLFLKNLQQLLHGQMTILSPCVPGKPPNGIHAFRAQGNKRLVSIGFSRSVMSSWALVLL